MRPHSPCGASALILGLTIAQGCCAQQPLAEVQKTAPTAFAAPEPKPGLPWGVGDGKSYSVPAFEIAGFELLLNRYDHYALDRNTYPSPLSNLRENLHHKWVVDNDKFATNQFLHPYQGAVYQGLARSAGLGFWESAGYTMAGSLLWEEAGEATRPSINDQVASGIGGNFLGEPLFRMASLLLESGRNGKPGRWREWGAAAISPSTGFNRLVHGARFDGVFPSYNPAVFTRVDVGASLSSHFSSNVNVNADLSAPPAFQTSKRGAGSASFTMSYGLPGKPDYAYDRPFDYFNFEFAPDTANIVETVFSRGLLNGASYALGDNYRGIWGLYGVYDYFAPQVFRVSTTGLAFGTTAQWWLPHSIAVQGTALLGTGYGGGGVIRGAGIEKAGPSGEGQRDYHYGITPQALLALRLIFGDRVSIDSTFREYYISHVAATESTGTEDVSRADISVTARIHKLHGITLRFVESNRNGRYAGLPNSHQAIGTFSIGYTLLGQTQFGAVDWRDGAEPPPD